MSLSNRSGRTVGSSSRARSFTCGLIALTLVGCAGKDNASDEAARVVAGTSAPVALPSTPPVKAAISTSSQSGFKSASAPTRQAATIDVVSGPHRMAQADGTVWLSTEVGTVLGVDVKRGVITHEIETGERLTGIAVAGGRIWAAANKAGPLFGIDPATDKVTHRVITDGSVRGVTASGSELWVAVGGKGKLLRIDAKTAKVIGETKAGKSPAQIAVSKTGVWVTDREDKSVVLADPAGGEPLATVDVGGSTIAIAADQESVWVVGSAEGFVARIDQASRLVAARVELPTPGFGAVLAEGSLWITGDDGVLRRLDAKTLAPLGQAAVGPNPIGAIHVGAEIWTANSTGRTLSRVPIDSVN